MQEPAQLMGLKAMTGRTIRFHIEFVIFDLVFRLAAGTIDALVEHLSAGWLHIRHDKAGVDALLRPFDLAHHPARVRPGPSLVARRVEAGDLAPTARRGPLGLLNDFPSQLR